MTRLFLLIWSIFLCESTTDLNKHQLRYVADHLTKEECEELVTLLELPTYAIKHRPKATKGSHGAPCIVQLQYWDQVTGKRDSFQKLTLRLKQIMRDDLADFLAKKVMEEKTGAVQKSFLDNPMKEMIATNSPMLVESEKDTPSYEKDHSKPPPGWTIVHTAGVVGGFAGIVVIGVIICVKCGCCDKWEKDYNKKLDQRNEKAKKKAAKGKKGGGGDSKTGLALLAAESGDEVV